jgi:hypothetical protein
LIFSCFNRANESCLGSGVHRSLFEISVPRSQLIAKPRGRSGVGMEDGGIETLELDFCEKTGIFCCGLGLHGGGERIACSASPSPPLEHGHAMPLSTMHRSYVNADRSLPAKKMQIAAGFTSALVFWVGNLQSNVSALETVLGMNCSSFCMI